MKTKLPAFNPFPALATTAVEEGSYLETYSSWAKATPTLPREPIERIASLTRRFQNSATGRRNPGQAVFVHGEHGSGKTHAIRAGIGQAATETDSKSVLPLYVKLSEPDFLHAYQLLMNQVSLPELTGIVLRFLGSLTRRGPLPVSVGEQVQRDPSILLELFDAHLVERGIILQKQADKMQSVVEGEVNFQRALTYLLEPDLQDAAYRWLQAKPVDQASLRRLGISGPLQSNDECRYGLQLLTLLCAQTGRHLIIMLDQAEKFLLDENNAVVPHNMGLVHRLVEAIPDIGGMLVVAGSEEAWSLLPVDLRQRFGSNDVACLALQPSELIAFLGVYIRAALDAEDRNDYAEPWPFTDHAAQKLLRNSGGNLRQLLQLAWRAYAEAPADAVSIGEDGIPDDLLDFDRKAVEMSLRRILWKLGQLEFDPRAGFDFALRPLNQGRILIRLAGPYFYADEAERAEEDVLARLTLADHDLRAERCALIVIGYVSQLARRLLEQAYDYILVYRDANSMAHQLAEMVSSGAQQTPGAGLDLQGIYHDLADLGWRRAQHSHQLRYEVTELARSHQATSMVQRFDALLARWPVQRDALMSGVRDARHRRAGAELEELHRVAGSARHWQYLRLGIQSVLLAASGVAAAALFTVSPVNEYGIETILGGAAVGIAVTIALGMLATLQSISLPQRPTSLPEAERVTRELFYKHESSLWRRFGRIPQVIARTWSRFWASSEIYQPPEGLRTRDPYRRYGYVLTRGHFLNRLDLRYALRIERVSVIRRALADRLGRVLADEAAGYNLSTSDAELLELPYIVQHCRAAYWEEIAALEVKSRLMIALTLRDSGGVRAGGPQRRDRDEHTLLGVHQDPGERRSRSEGDAAILHILRACAGQGALGAAYEAGIVHGALIAASAEIKDHDLRRAQDLLSPRDGLGAFDHLRLTPELDRLYLFFEQLRFFRDGGALG